MNSIQRVARNSLIPMATQLVNKLLDLAFIFYALRVLGVDGTGSYDFAVNTWLLVKTASDFGLGVLATREVARKPGLASLWLGGGTTARVLVLAGLLPLLALVLAAFYTQGRLSLEAALATVLLVASIAPGALADSATAIFHARERMTVPALVTVLSTVLKVLIGGLVLFLGGVIGFTTAALVVGLAAASLVVNSISTIVLWRLVRPLVPDVRWWPGRDQVRSWLLIAWPLLLNNLLANLFFRLDIYVIQAARGTTELGFYTATYRFINFALIVPPYVTMALFPGLARQAERDHAALRRTLRLAVGYLVMLALPAAVATTALADLLIWILAGSQFLPGSAEALRVLIWFLPFSYVNGLIQYVLIALDRQRIISGAFALTVVFNLVANLLLVPPYGYMGAAMVTVASEIVLLGPLLVATHRALGRLDLVTTVWRPTVATIVMGGVVLGAWGLGSLPATLLGGIAYLLTLFALGAWGEEERRLLRALRGQTGTA